MNPKAAGTATLKLQVALTEWQGLVAAGMETPSVSWVIDRAFLSYFHFCTRVKGSKIILYASIGCLYITQESAQQGIW